MRVRRGYGTDLVDAPVQGAQPSLSNSILDGGGADPGGEQLPAGNDAVLSGSEGGDRFQYVRSCHGDMREEGAREWAVGQVGGGTVKKPGAL